MSRFAGNTADYLGLCALFLLISSLYALSAFTHARLDWVELLISFIWFLAASASAIRAYKRRQRLTRNGTE